MKINVESVDKKNMWSKVFMYLIQLVVGIFFVMKGTNGIFSSVSQEFYLDNAWAFVNILAEMPILNWTFEGIYILAGALLILNFMVPTVLLAVVSMTVLGLIFEVSYSTVLDGPLTAIGVMFLIGILFYNHRKFFKVFFGYQLNSSFMPFRKTTPQVLVLESIKKNHPDMYNELLRNGDAEEGLL